MDCKVAHEQSGGSAEPRLVLNTRAVVLPPPLPEPSVVLCKGSTLQHRLSTAQAAYVSFAWLLNTFINGSLPFATPESLLSYTKRSPRLRSFILPVQVVHCIVFGSCSHDC